jgi:predicted phage terminase large subunit-like protein
MPTAAPTKAPQVGVKLNAKLIEGFAGTFLSPMYDNPKPTPPFHRQCWALYCDPTARLAAVAAPRGHAKSTALTHDYTLATALFRVEDYIILVGSNEELAIEALGDIARELRENDELIEYFGIQGFETDAKTDIIVNCQLPGESEVHQFRIIARGSGQKMRGRKWKGKRPGLIICDDLEDDEQIESKERRDKFRKWFFRALIPAMRRGGKVRVHGTILHEDSLLSRLMKNKTWKTLLFKAHASFDDFNDILWPEQFTEPDLRDIRQSFINEGDAAGYSQEYLNNPLDNSIAYLKKDDFRPMSEDDYFADMRKNIGCDFAVSKKDKANRTSFTVGGLTATNRINIIDQWVDRWESDEIIEQFFSLQERHEPDWFFVEQGVIWLTLWPLLKKEMEKRGVFINCFPILSAKDKRTRGRSFQKRMRAGAMRFDKKAEWYIPYEEENLRFTGLSESTLDDQFDSTSILCIGIDMLPELTEEDFMEEEELEMIRTDRPTQSAGRNVRTGY